MQTCAFGCDNSSLPPRAGVNGLKMEKSTFKSLTPRVYKSLWVNDLVVFVSVVLLLILSRCFWGILRLGRKLFQRLDPTGIAAPFKYLFVELICQLTKNKDFCILVHRVVMNSNEVRFCFNKQEPFSFSNYRGQGVQDKPKLPHNNPKITTCPRHCGFSPKM